VAPAYHGSKEGRRMLIITRRRGQKFMLGDDIVVEVVEVSGSTVRIGIDAPKAIRVYREEIWQAIKAENEASAASSAKLPE
jgi:carbon storage regulator